MKMPLSVTIITFNEENNILKTLESVSFANEIIIVDSFSSDNTVKICEDFGAKVFQNKFLGYGEQKNFAASKACHDWILNIDSDEVVDEALKNDILNILLKEVVSEDLYIVERLTYFCGRPIFHGGWFPDRVIRMYNKRCSSFTEGLHEVVKGSGEHKTLKGILHHYSFETVKSQVERNIRYAHMGSLSLYKKSGRPTFFKLLYRPFFKFLECYLLKMGFLNGKRGLIIAFNASYSLFMKYSFIYFSDKTE